MNDLNRIRKRMKQRKKKDWVKQESILNDSHFNKFYRMMIKSMCVMVLGLAIMTYIKANPKDIYVRNFVFNDTLLTYLRPYLYDLLIPVEESQPVSVMVNYEWVEGNYYKNPTNQVYALNGGIVRFKGQQAILGNYILVQQDNDVKVIYGCLNDVQVDLYDRVEKGTILASYQDSMMMIFEKNEQEISYEEALMVD